jgi:hypothetical protein
MSLKAFVFNSNYLACIMPPWPFAPTTAGLRLVREPQDGTRYSRVIIPHTAQVVGAPTFRAPINILGICSSTPPVPFIFVLAVHGGLGGPSASLTLRLTDVGGFPGTPLGKGNAPLLVELKLNSLMYSGTTAEQAAYVQISVKFYYIELDFDFKSQSVSMPVCIAHARFIVLT